MKESKAISGTKKNRVYDLAASVSNSDFLRAARLARSTKKKDKDELKKQDESTTHRGE